MRTFLAVVRERTVTEAANTLGLAPSSVSQQIRVLEDGLGVSLFDRSPTGMTLTEAGNRLLDWAPRLLDDLDRARREVAGVRRPLRFGSLETLIATRLPPVLTRMEERCPKIRLDIVPFPTRGEVLTGLLGADLDAALVLDLKGVREPDLPATGGRLDFVDLEPVTLVPVVRPTHPLAGRRTVTRADLREHKVLLGPTSCLLHLAADLFFGSYGQRVELPSLFVAVNWALQGLGIVLTPEFIVDGALASGELVRIELEEAPPEAWLRLVWRSDREPEPELRTLLYTASELTRAEH
ncbi:LysR family transcriptional regulator [Actinocorallia sp. B10E7]|uniref:LysR family transcriptional regulator n=1 Tax=Actinocorallia sp. B10E7 TaxID=3153558 RepID=UPI00325D4FCF